MAGTPLQKERPLYLLRILCERTDAEHPMSLAELGDALGQLGVSGERKALYRDLRALKQAGFSVCTVRSKDVRYYWDGSPFSRQDLILLSNLIRISSSDCFCRTPQAKIGNREKIARLFRLAPPTGLLRGISFGLSRRCRHRADLFERRTSH